MAKKVKFESFVYRFLIEANALGGSIPEAQSGEWREFVSDLRFRYEAGAAHIAWDAPVAGETAILLDQAMLYQRGDTPQAQERQLAFGQAAGADEIEARNRALFRGWVEAAALKAGFRISRTAEHERRLAAEAVFHDAWAASTKSESIDVVKSNEACTAPEMRFIRARLGDLRGKSLLDVGCGLGEASVYFALQGARVTALDLSQGMLEATQRLAARYGVAVRTHRAAAEELLLDAAERFDVIYAGNLLHHVEIEKTLRMLRPHLAPGGLLVTWDPLAYNPAINAYRAMATEVRTPDEHPLRMSDLRTFRRLFGSVETRYFWLTTLVIFVIMALVQRRNPNKERFWKVIIDEGGRWRWLYAPLERLDRLLLAVLPFLRPLCWNVVVVARD